MRSGSPARTEGIARATSSGLLQSTQVARLVIHVAHSGLLEPWRVFTAASHSGGMPTDSDGDVAHPTDVFSDGERLWRARAGATSTFEENVGARELFLDLHQDEFWNPWRMEELRHSLTIWSKPFTDLLPGT